MTSSSWPWLDRELARRAGRIPLGHFGPYWRSFHSRGSLKKKKWRMLDEDSLADKTTKKNTPTMISRPVKAFLFAHHPSALSTLLAQTTSGIPPAPNFSASLIHSRFATGVERRRDLELLVRFRRRTLARLRAERRSARWPIEA